MRCCTCWEWRTSFQNPSWALSSSSSATSRSASSRFSAWRRESKVGLRPVSFALYSSNSSMFSFSPLKKCVGIIYKIHGNVKGGNLTFPPFILAILCYTFLGQVRDPRAQYRDRKVIQVISHGKEVKVFAGNANIALASSICDQLHKPLGKADVKHFAGRRMFHLRV